MTTINWCVIGSIVLILWLIIVIFVVRKINELIAFAYMEKTYTILNTALQQVYNIIFRNHILSYKTNGQTLDKTILNDLRKQYVENVYAMIGPRILKRLIKIHGNKHAVEMYIVFRFEDFVDQDILLSNSQSTT